MDQEPDVLVPDPILWREFNICAMTWWRWEKDPTMAELGFPQKVKIRRYNYRSRRQTEKFKRNLMRAARAPRAGARLLEDA